MKKGCKIIAWMLAVSIFMGVVPLPGEFSIPASTVKAASIGITSQQLVNKANSYLGKRNVDKENPNGYFIGKGLSWCAAFVARCFQDLNASIGSHGAVTCLLEQALNNYKGVYYCYDSLKLFRHYRNGEGWHTLRNQKDVILVNKNDFAPRKGDLICFYWNPSSDTSGLLDHIGIVTDVNEDRGYLTYVDGNSGASGAYADVRYVYEHTNYPWKSKQSVFGFFRPNYTDVDNDVTPVNLNPIGNFDTARSEPGQLVVNGWAFDPDNNSAQLDIIIRLYTTNDVKIEEHRIKANKHRPDPVQFHPGIGEYHGFEETIQVATRGNCKIKAFAVDTNDSHETQLSGEGADRIVNIPLVPMFINAEQSSVSMRVNGSSFATFTYGGEGYQTYGWSFSKEGIVDNLSIRKDEDGEFVLGFRALKAGSTRLQVALCDSNYIPIKSAYVDINVQDNPTGSINKDNITLRVGETEQLQAILSDGSEPLMWGSSDDEVIKVDAKTGKVTAVGPGVGVVTLYITLSVREKCYVTVLPAGMSEDRTQSITPEEDSVRLKINETKEINLTYKDGFEVGTEADYRIDASSGDVCAVEIRDLNKTAKTAKLFVRGLKEGTTNIRLHLMDPIRNSVFDMALPVLVESEESEPEEPEGIDEVFEGDVPSGGVPDGYWAAVDTNFMYTGNPIEATLRVYKNRRLLTKGNDYTVSYTNNTNVGNASVTITGIGQHSFSIRDSFKIIGKSIEDGVAALDSEWYMYNGNPVIPTVTVYYGGSQLQKDKDYTVRLENNSGAGKGKVYITGKGLYQGEIIKEFDIYQEIGDTTESITLPSAISMNVGEKKTITATTSPSGLAVDWYIDEEDIAVIDQNTGEITAQKAGKATIIAMSKEAYATCELTVTGSQQPAAGGDVEFNLGNVTGDVFPGGTVKIPVNIGGNDGFCSLGIQFSYDSSIFDFQSIQIDPEISSKISLKDDYQKAPGVINAAYVCNKNITGKNTTFGHLVLTVKENAVVGKNFTVSIIYRDVLNENDERLNVTGTRTSVTGRIVEVPRVIPGDLNGDKKPGLQDARMVLQYVTKVVGFTLNEKQLEAADVNRDGRVNLVDALWILEYYTEKRASF